MIVCSMEILSVKELNLSIEGKDLIKDGSFSISSGDVVLLTGPNGCGKSTFIKVLLGAAFDYKDLDYSNSTVLYRQSHSILSSEKENAFFRNNIVYVSQEDEFESESLSLFSFIFGIKIAKPTQIIAIRAISIIKIIFLFFIYKNYRINTNNISYDYGKKNQHKICLNKQKMAIYQIAISSIRFYHTHIMLKIFFKKANFLILFIKCQ